MNRLLFNIFVAVLLVPPAIACGATFDGFTEPFRKIEVAAGETGTVARVAVHEGDRVSKGQVLATLDSDVLEVSREIARANVEAQSKLASAAAERELRRTRLGRLAPLLAEGHASQEEIDRAQADLAVAEANLRAAEEQHRLDLLERKKVEAMIQRRTIRSPIDGYVLKIQKEECEFVSANSPGLATVVELDPLRAVFSLSGAYAARLAVGGSVDLELPESGLKLRGKVEFIAPVTEAESGTVRVKVLIDNAEGKYRCGARCSLVLAEPADASAASAPGTGTSEK